MHQEKIKLQTVVEEREKAEIRRKTQQDVMQHENVQKDEICLQNTQQVDAWLPTVWSAACEQVGGNF